MAVDILSKHKKPILFTQSKCQSCGETYWKLNELEKKGGKLFCPTCKKEVDTCLVHILQMEYGEREYWWPIHFTKTLDIFEFPKISRLDGISLRR